MDVSATDQRRSRGRHLLAISLGLGLALLGAAQVVAAPSPSVSGSYTYSVPGGRHVTIQATSTDGEVRGTWNWTNTTGGGKHRGPITCLVVDGTDAWLAGPTEDGALAQFTYVHDGGAPGVGNDFVITWITDPGQTLADMEAWCEGQTDLGFNFGVESGNVTVR